MDWDGFTWISGHLWFFPYIYNISVINYDRKLIYNRWYICPIFMLSRKIWDTSVYLLPSHWDKTWTLFEGFHHHRRYSRPTLLFCVSASKSQSSILLYFWLSMEEELLAVAASYILWVTGEHHFNKDILWVISCMMVADPLPGNCWRWGMSICIEAMFWFLSPFPSRWRFNLCS